MSAEEGAPYHSASFEAIGVLNQVTVVDGGSLAEALAIAQAEVAALDLACSRFRDDSELVRLNEAAGRPGKVSQLLLEAIRVALGAAQATDGLVDPTVGAAMRGLGYDRDFDVVVAAGAVPEFTLVPATGWRSVSVDVEHSTVRVPSGTELDLGATAKALGSDCIAAAVAEATGTDVLVSLGGDIAVQGAPEGGWPIRVTDDSRGPADGPGQTVAISSGGLATSSTTVRRWRAGAVEVHHIIDPATGRPAAEHWRTVSVAADSCVGANVASTAAILKGAAALPWLESLGVAARLVHVDGTVERTSTWPA